MKEILVIDRFTWENDQFILAKTKKGVAYFGKDDIENLFFCRWQKKFFPNNKIENCSNELRNERIEFIQFLKGERRFFTFDIDLYGTSFQKKVWKSLEKIPYGKTSTYTNIASAIENKRAVRAVANAIGKNPLLLYIPCHRIIRKDGKLGGFRDGINFKKRLLKMEKANNTF